MIEPWKPDIDALLQAAKNTETATVIAKAVVDTCNGDKVNEIAAGIIKCFKGQRQGDVMMAMAHCTGVMLSHYTDHTRPFTLEAFKNLIESAVEIAEEEMAEAKANKEKTDGQETDQS